MHSALPVLPATWLPASDPFPGQPSPLRQQRGAADDSTDTSQPVQNGLYPKNDTRGSCPHESQRHVTGSQRHRLAGVGQDLEDRPPRANPALQTPHA